MTKKASTKAETEETAGAAEEKNTAKKTTAKKANNKKADKSDKSAEKAKPKQSKEQEKLIKEIEELKEKLADAEENSGVWHNKYLRLSAEFDNYRKRTLKEKADLSKYAKEDVLKEILSVVDDFERGIDNIEKSEDVTSLKEGVNLIYTKFIEFTRQNGVKEIEAKEKEFDLDFHEAITKIPAPNEDLKGKVVDVIEKGYLLNDKVIRYSKVVIGE